MNKKQKRFYNQKALKSNIYYKANYIIFLVVCFLLGIDKRNTNNKVKNRICKYAFNHNKFIHFIVCFISNIFAIYMFFTKFECEYLNCLETQDTQAIDNFIQEINKKYYNESSIPIYYNVDYEDYCLEKKSLLLFLIIVYIEKKKFLYNSIQIELQRTRFYYYDKRYKIKK